MAIVAVITAAAGCTTKKLATTDTTSTSTTSASTTSTARTGTTQATGTTSTGSGSGDSVVAPDSAWDLNATVYRGQNGLRVRVDCPPDGTPYSVWGSGTYTDDSSICTAAVHAGLITIAAGGTVVIQIAPGLEQYTGTEANGITTSSYGAWSGSYVFVS